jgi:signal recognition particle subunit SEC65
VSELVQVALAESVAEAEELQEILRQAGIEAQLETAVDHHPREVEDAPQKVLVPESELEAARDAIEALTEPDDPII